MARTWLGSTGRPVMGTGGAKALVSAMATMVGAEGTFCPGEVNERGTRGRSNWIGCGPSRSSLTPRERAHLFQPPDDLRGLERAPQIEIRALLQGGVVEVALEGGVARLHPG